MLRFLVELRKVKKEFRAKFGDEEFNKKKHGIFCKSVVINSKLMEYSSLKILGGYVIKRNHHVISLDLNGPKIMQL